MSHKNQTNFYIAGGNLDKEARCYVQRQADTDLYQALKQQQFCYVLTSRQMGKSSLMVRVTHRLRQEDVVVVMFELSKIGNNVTIEQWYDGLLTELGRQLDLEDELKDFWDNNQGLELLHRWIQALRTVVLAHYQQPVTIFIDEIDVVRSLPFSTDEFFAGIRHCYNARAEEPELQRLTFCLIGVATPSDLIADPHTTPFYIGKRIDLNDFTSKEAAPLAAGLQRYDEQQAILLLERILYWTHGQPYLTQILCQKVATDKFITQAAGVDKLCEEMFFSSRSRETEPNLQMVRTYLLSCDKDRAALLNLYHQVRAQTRIRDDETNPLSKILQLSGLIRIAKNYLWVRNRIYFRVFDEAWIDANRPDAEERRQKIQAQLDAYLDDILLDREELDKCYIDLLITAESNTVSPATKDSIVPAEFQTISHQFHPAPAENKLLTSISEALELHDCFVLLGAPGAGKTMTLKKLQLDSAKLARQNSTARMPVLINLASWYDDIVDLQEFLNHQLKNLPYIPWNRQLLLLDSLDKMPFKKYVPRIKMFENWLQDNPHLSVIIGCQEDYYQQNKKLPLPTVQIAPFNSKRIR